MISLEIAQEGRIVDIFFVTLKGRRRVYEVYQGTDACYTLKHFHNRDFLTAEQTSSSGRVKVQEGLGV